MNCFSLTEKPGTDLYILQNKLHSMYGIVTSGSYNVAPARLLNMTFKEYLEFCRDSLGARISFGNNTLYPAIYFRDNEVTRKFIRLLNDCVEKTFKKSFEVKI